MTLLPMENGESILCALKCFEQEKPSVIPPILEEYIRQISKNGQTRLPWIYVKPLLLQKYNKVVDSFISEESGLDYPPIVTPPHLEELRQRVFSTLKRLDGIPFTIQRICELFDTPTRHYQRVDKFLRGLEKVCMVVSTVDPYGNKIHQEDPRFPSRAGLDEYELMDSSITSPPNSPSADNLQIHHASKSSDEEATEEEEDDEGEDNSSDASDERQSPKSEHNLSSTPLMSTSCASSWLFKAQGPLNLPHTPPIPSRNSTPKIRLTDQSLTGAPLLGSLCGSLLTAYSNNDEEDYEQLSRSTEKNPTSSDVQVNSCRVLSVTSKLSSESSECSNGLHVGSTLQVESASTATHEHLIVEDQTNDNSLSWGEGSKIPILSMKNMEDLNPQCENKPDKMFIDSIVDAVPQNDPPIKGLSLDTSDIENSSPVSQILRPIGQLEAFVQNLNSEVSGSATNTVPSHSGSSISAIDASAHLNFAASGDDLHQGSTPSASSSTLSPTFAGVRRPRSPDMDLNGNTDISANRDADLSESPAKRRRLLSSDLNEAIETINESLVGYTAQVPVPSSLALNDSPPIIMCNPISQARDMDSGECVFETEEKLVTEQSDVHSVSSSDRTDLLTVISISSAQNSEVNSESVEVSEATSLVNENTELSISNSANIDSETGEEEP
ncbi:unnamed protein product [Heterobilharzia americana]|nr:unnamed protein product [Heterobilharzia americana]